MANDQLPEIDYAQVIADLKAKRVTAVREREALDLTIQNLDRAIISISILGAVPYQGDIVAYPVNSDLENLSLYQAALAVLKSRGKPMTNFEMVTALRAGGKQTNNDLAGLYTSINERGVKSEIIRTGARREGRWELKEWHPELV